MAETHEKHMQFGKEGEEEEYVLLELDDCLYSDIQPNAPYVLSGLDTLTPTLTLDYGLKMIGEYQETVGTCYLFSETNAPPKPIRGEMTPCGESKDKQGSSSSKQVLPSKEVKHLASVQRILKFRSMDVDHKQHRACRDNDKEIS